MSQFKALVKPVSVLLFLILSTSLIVVHLVTLSVRWEWFLIMPIGAIWLNTSWWSEKIVVFITVLTSIGIFLGYWILGLFLGSITPQIFVDTVYGLRNLSFWGFAGYYVAWWISLTIMWFVFILMIKPMKKLFA